MTTAVTAAQLAQLRRMVGEPTPATYSDIDLTAVIEQYPTLDENGESPRIHAADAVRPVVFTAYMDVLDLIDNPDWIPTYDLAAAAADIWAEKAAVPAADFDMSADGANLARSQVYDQAMKQSRYYGSKRKAGTITLKPEPHRRLNGGLY